MVTKLIIVKWAGGLGPHRPDKVGVRPPDILRWLSAQTVNKLTCCLCRTPEPWQQVAQEEIDRLLASGLERVS